MAAVPIRWKCEKATTVQMPLTDSVGSFRSKVVDSLTEEYGLEDDADVKLLLPDGPLLDDSISLQSAGIVKNSLVQVLSNAVAEVSAERSKVTSMREVFEQLKVGGSTTVEEELDVLRKAEPFDMCCPTMELGELGAGVPVVFQFICFLILLFLFLFLAHIPALYSYAIVDKRSEWPWISTVNTTAVNTTSKSCKSPLIRHYELTAGNLGPDSTSSSMYAWIALACGIVSLIGGAMFSQKIRAIKGMVDQSEVDASDFALFVEGLPSDMVDEKELKSWMERNLLSTGTVEVVKVVIGFNISEFQKLTAELQALKQEISNCQDDTEKAELQKKYTEVNKTLTSEDSLMQTLGGTGCAVVIMQLTTHHRQVIREWNSFGESLARTCQCLTGGLTGLSKKPLFRHNGEDYMLSVERADLPSDMLWENLGVPFQETCKTRARSWCTFFLIFLVAFGIIFGARFLRAQYPCHNLFLWGAVLAMCLTAVLCKREIDREKDRERYETKTRRDISVLVKLSAMYFMNYVLALFLCSLPPAENWFSGGGVVSASLMFLIIGMFIVSPLWYLCCAECIKRRLAKAVGNLQEPTTQAALNKLKAPPEFDSIKVYSLAMKNYFIAIFYLPVMPIGALFAFLGYLIFYWCVKYHLLRHCKRPYKQSAEPGYVAVKLVFFGTLMYAFSQWFLLSYTLKGDGESWSMRVMFILLIAAGAFLILPRHVYRVLLCTFLCCPKTDVGDHGDIDYFDAQKTWAKHQKYHTSNMVYLFLEQVYGAKKAAMKDFVLPWDLKTGNFPKPGATEEPETPTGSGDVLGPKPGTLGISGLAGDEKPLSELDVGEGEEDAPAETAAIADADPAELALQELMHALPLEAVGADPDAADSDSDVAVSEDGDESVEGDTRPLPTSSLLAGSAAGSYKPGSTAIISDLESAPQYNDTSCTILEYDAAADKYVCLLHDGQKARLRTSNLAPEMESYAPGTQVQIDGLEKGEQFNGTVATVVGFNRETKKYEVKLFTGAKAFIPADKLTPADS